MGVAPEVFEVGEDDELTLLMEEPPDIFGPRSDKRPRRAQRGP